MLRTHADALQLSTREGVVLHDDCHLADVVHVQCSKQDRIGILAEVAQLPCSRKAVLPRDEQGRVIPLTR